MIVGDGDYRYRVNADWAKLPEGWSFKEVGGVGVDSRDNVYVFNRGDHPMMVFDRDGNFLRSWAPLAVHRPSACSGVKACPWLEQGALRNTSDAKRQSRQAC